MIAPYFFTRRGVDFWVKKSEKYFSGHRGKRRQPPFPPGSGVTETGIPYYTTHFRMHFGNENRQNLSGNQIFLNWRDGKMLVSDQKVFILTTLLCGGICRPPGIGGSLVQSER